MGSPVGMSRNSLGLLVAGVAHRREHEVVCAGLGVLPNQLEAEATGTEKGKDMAVGCNGAGAESDERDRGASEARWRLQWNSKRGETAAEEERSGGRNRSTWRHKAAASHPTIPAARVLG